MASFYKVNNDEQIPILKDADELGLFLQSTRNKLKIKILSLTENEIVFDLIGVDASIANALRRILLAEVPTMAIETVYIQTNTSIIQDEVLSHRLGLIPIKADPKLFDELLDGEDPTDQNTIVFRLDVLCVNEDSETVYSRDLEWQPQGDQREKFPGGILPVHEDIIIAKLKPGQHIQLEAHCRKGVGKDHAKFSPCGTASYRLMPDIIFPTAITGFLAEELAQMCPLKVFDIEDIRSIPTAVVARPRDCTMCRECIRLEGWADRVHLRRVADHFIFSVESIGAMPPAEIVKQAIEQLRMKALQFQGHVDEWLEMNIDN